MHACTQHRAGGEGPGGEGACVSDMFELEFGDENVEQSRKYKSGACPEADYRTQVCEIFPGGLQDWEFDVGL